MPSNLGQAVPHILDSLGELGKPPCANRGVFRQLDYQRPLGLPIKGEVLVHLLPLDAPLLAACTPPAVGNGCQGTQVLGMTAQIFPNWTLHHNTFEEMRWTHEAVHGGAYMGSTETHSKPNCICHNVAGTALPGVTATRGFNTRLACNNLPHQILIRCISSPACRLQSQA